MKTAPLVELGTIQRGYQFTFALCRVLIPIAFLVIGFSFIGASVVAETESEDSSDIFSEPIRVDTQEEQDGTEAQSEVSPDIPSESVEKNSPQIGDVVEVNTRSEQWQDIHSGDLSSGTIKFRIR
jgi:hypothetical protein